MNALQAEVLNVLHSNGKDDWTVAELLETIPNRRGDSEIPKPTERHIQEAGLALFEAGEVTRCRDRDGSRSWWVYTAAIPDTIIAEQLDMIIAEPLELFFNWFSSLKFKWICVLCAVVLLPYCGWLAA